MVSPFFVYVDTNRAGYSMHSMLWLLTGRGGWLLAWTCTECRLCFHIVPYPSAAQSRPCPDNPETNGLHRRILLYGMATSLPLPQLQGTTCTLRCTLKESQQSLTHAERIAIRRSASLSGPSKKDRGDLDLWLDCDIWTCIFPRIAEEARLAQLAIWSNQSSKARDLGL